MAFGHLNYVVLHLIQVFHDLFDLSKGLTSGCFLSFEVLLNLIIVLVHLQDQILLVVTPFHESLLSFIFVFPHRLTDNVLIPLKSDCFHGVYDIPVLFGF
jgi:hypothetical protein